MNIEERNYWNDERVCERARPPELDGEPLPYVFEVCPVCRGKGSHVNPSIDASGLTAEDFHDDPEFSEHYREGLYDQTCNRCGGMRVVQVVDRDQCDADLLAKYDAEADADADYQAMVRAERASGA